MGALRTIFLASLGLLFSLETQAACDCANSQASPWCTGSSVSQTSPNSTTITVNFDATYTCGQYANGDFWVVGSGSPKMVDVGSTSPDWEAATGSPSGHYRNGWDTNLAGCHHLDTRNLGYCGSAPSLPGSGYNVESGPISFLKVAGRNGNGSSTGYLCDDQAGLRETCIKYSMVVTFVAAVPDSDSDGSTADEFRPGLSGATKLGPYRTDMLTTGLDHLGLFDADAVNNESEITFSGLASRFSCAFFYMWAPEPDTKQEYPQETLPTDCLPISGASTGTYGTDFALLHRAIPLRFALDDFDYAGNSTHKMALIRTVQHGIDLASEFNGGFRTRAADPTTGAAYNNTFGGVMVGHKDPVVFSAFMLSDSTLKGIATSRYYYESDQAYRSSVDGYVYYGIGSSGSLNVCPDDGSGFEGGVHCAHPSEQMDASCRINDGGCTSSSCYLNQPASYYSQTSNSAPYTVLWLQMLHAGAYWEDTTPWTIWARSWLDGGRGPGHTHYRWSGVESDNGCENTRNNTAYESPFANEMWTEFAASCTAHACDFNEDGVVGSSDYALIGSHFNMSGYLPYTEGDCTGDGVVGSADLAKYGSTQGTDDACLPY